MKENPGNYRLITEYDVIETLKSGDEGGAKAVRGRMMRLGEQLGMNEMIETSAMHALRYDGTKVQESGYAADGVFNAWQDMHRLKQEQDRYIKREIKLAREDARKAQLIWSGFYNLESGLRRVLELYYIEHKDADAVADELGVSVSTVWRRRKKAVDEIKDICRSITCSCVDDTLLSG